MAKLQPCPFCGEPYAVVARANFAHIHCHYCRVRVGWEIDDEGETVRRWNDRRPSNAKEAADAEA